MACTYPRLQPAGVTAYTLVAMGLQELVGQPTRGAGGTGVVEDYLIFGVERLERFLSCADPHRAGDVRGAILPLAQGHDNLEAVTPVEFRFQLLGVDEIRIVHLADSFRDKALRAGVSTSCPLPCGWVNNRFVGASTMSFTGSLAYAGIISGEADRQHHPKARLAWSGHDLDVSPVLVDDDVVGDMQAKAGADAGRLGGKEGFENAWLNLRGNPRSIVDDIDFLDRRLIQIRIRLDGLDDLRHGLSALSHLLEQAVDRRTCSQPPDFYRHLCGREPFGQPLQLIPVPAGGDQHRRELPGLPHAVVLQPLLQLILLLAEGQRVVDRRYGLALCDFLLQGTERLLLACVGGERVELGRQLLSLGQRVT